MNQQTGKRQRYLYSFLVTSEIAKFTKQHRGNETGDILSFNGHLTASISQIIHGETWSIDQRASPQVIIYHSKRGSAAWEMDIKWAASRSLTLQMGRKAFGIRTLSVTHNYHLALYFIGLRSFTSYFLNHVPKKIMGKSCRGASRYDVCFGGGRGYIEKRT